jgi:hypothetical protein
MQVIAERELEFYSPRGKKPKKVTVRLGKPQRDNSGENWRVPVEIEGPAPGQIFRKDAWGDDSMQAIVEAVWLIPVFLRAALADSGGRLAFQGSSELGFYREPHEFFRNST